MKIKILITLLLISFFASGQVLQKINTYGYEYKRVLADSLSGVPSDTLVVPGGLTSFAWLARKDNVLYIWSTTNNKWESVATAGSGEINTASNLAGNGIGVWKDKSGVDLRFKRLKNVYGLILTDMTDSVGFDVDTSLITSRAWHNKGLDSLSSLMHVAVTLAGENYLSLSGQQITAGAINLSGTHVTSTLNVGNGGTGAATLTGVLVGSGTSAFTGVVGTASQLLRRNAGNTAYEFFTPTYLTSEVDGSTTNELQTLANTSAATTHTVTLSNSGGSIQLAEGSGITLTTTGTGLDGIVTIASTGGGYTTLSQFVDETAWRMFYSNTLGDVTPFALGAANTVLLGNGITSAPTWGTVANAALTNSAITINGTSVSLGGTRTLTLASADFVNQGTTTTVLHGNAAGNPSWAAVSLTADVSGDLPFSSFVQGAANTVVTNPTAILADFTTTALSANTLLGMGSTGNIAAITVGGILSFSGAVLSATEVDGSISNELQTLASTSDATSHTVTLSNSGGSIQLVEGSNITLTTTGTGLNGIVTIASTGGGSGVTTMTAIGATPNANGASISGVNLTLQPADGTYGGVLTAIAQDIAGLKTFISSSSRQILLKTTDAYSTPPTTGIAFQTKYNSGGSYTDMGYVSVSKVNGVDGEFGSRMTLWSRTNGGSLTTAYQLNSEQENEIGSYINADAGDYKLQVGGPAIINPFATTKVGLTIQLPAAAAEDAFQLKNSGGTVISFISEFGTFKIGGEASDPSGSNGMVHYNTTTNTFRGFENGTWKDLIATGGAAHNILSSTHTDATVGTVARGDLITGQTATPAWTRLAKGTANQVLSMDGTGTDIIWATASGGGDMVLASAQTNSGVKTFLDGTMGLRNVANTFTSVFTNTNTAARTYTLQNAAGTLAFLSDITTPGIDDVLAVGQALTTTRTITTGANSLTLTGSVTTLSVTSTGGTASIHKANPSSTNSVAEVLAVQRTTTGTAAVGIGGSIVYYSENSSGTEFSMMNLEASLTNVTAGSVSSKFVIKGLNAGVSEDRFTLLGTGQLQLNKYVSSAFTGTAVNTLQVDASGNVIMGGLGSGYTTMSQFVDETAWGIYYANASGDMTRLALGGAGTYLQSNGASLAPTWATPGGSGDMVLASAQTNSGVKTFLDGTMGLRNVANTFTSVFQNAATAARTYTLQNASGTLAFLTDITGTNSGTNTGDQNLFSNIPVSGQTTVTANSTTTALTLVAGTNMTITTDNTAKSVTFNSPTRGIDDVLAVGQALTASRTINASGGAGYNITFNMADNTPVIVQSNTAKTTTLTSVFSQEHNTSGTAAAGFGLSNVVALETSNGTQLTASQFATAWTDATTATASSEYYITLYNSGSQQRNFTISGSGQIKLDRYGVNTFTGTAAYWLAVTSAGQLIEMAAPGGGGMADPGGNGVVVRTALNTTINRTLTGTANRITITNGDGVSANPTFDIGSDVVTLTGSQTLTNKTLTAPVISSIVNTGTLSLPTITSTVVTFKSASEASNATPTPSGDAKDNEHYVTAQAAAAAFAAPSGTATNGNKIFIRIKDNGTARALSFNAIYRGGTDIALPTTTVVNKTMYLGFAYNSADTKWDLIAQIDGLRFDWIIYLIALFFAAIATKVEAKVISMKQKRKIAA